MTAKILAFPNCPTIPEAPLFDEGNAESWIAEILKPCKNECTWDESAPTAIDGDELSRSFNISRTVASVWLSVPLAASVVLPVVA